MSQAPPSGDKLKLVVAYDGTEFHGFAAQPNVRTVESVLSNALENVLRSPREALGLVCAGRTDTGVHAWGQVVSIQTFVAFEPERLRRTLNAILGPEIVVRRCERVDPTFDARRSAKWRRYRYTILNQPEPDPFVARYSWWISEPLDIARLRLAADPFMGLHDFASFCRKGPEGSTTRRRVLESKWLDNGDGTLVYDVRATAFCHRMVRSLVGTMVDAATDRMRPGDIMNILRARDRQIAGQIAPPQGLTLESVGY